MRITERLAGETAREYALRELKENIISLELKPGTAVSENELAAEFGISRTPVREALAELVKVSILEIYPQRGSFVSLIDPKMVDESRFLRKVLDRAVIEVACNMASPVLIDEMEENVHLQEFYLEKQDADRIFELDNAFHKLIYTAAQKDILYEMRSNMMIHFDRVRTLSVESVKDMKIVADHRDMLEAIKAKDSVGAVKLVDKHLSRYQVDEYQIREEFPEYFK